MSDITAGVIGVLVILAGALVLFAGSNGYDVSGARRAIFCLELGGDAQAAAYRGEMRNYSQVSILQAMERMGAKLRQYDAAVRVEEGSSDWNRITAGLAEEKQRARILIRSGWYGQTMKELTSCMNDFR